MIQLALCDIELLWHVSYTAIPANYVHSMVLLSLPPSHGYNLEKDNVSNKYLERKFNWIF